MNIKWKKKENKSLNIIAKYTITETQAFIKIL